MKFLTDENIPPVIVKELRAQGFEVLDIKEQGLYGVSDRDIARLATQEQRIVITHDKDFAYINGCPTILLKIKGLRIIELADILRRVIGSDLSPKLQSSLTIISASEVRVHRRP